MLGKAITYKTTAKCLAENRTAKYEASVGPAENLPPSVQRSDEFQKLLIYIYIIHKTYLIFFYPHSNII